MTSEEYWRDREEQNRTWTLERVGTYNERVNGIYTRMRINVQDSIDGFYQRYANAQGITMAEARKAVSEVDIKRYETKAQQYIQAATEGDMSAFSKQANDEMRLYNLTMKINRLEMLKAEIGVAITCGTEELNNYVSSVLKGEALQEYDRLTGILGETVQGQTKRAGEIANGSFHNATYSDRIWNNDRTLKNSIGQKLQDAIIAGRGSRALAGELVKEFGISQYNAERLMTTEIRRIQTEVAKDVMLENGNTHYIFMAVGSHPCPACMELDGQVFKISEMMAGTNAPPMHPQCHCATAPVWDEEKYQSWLDSGATAEGVEFEDYDYIVPGEKERSYGHIVDDGKRELGHVDLDIVNTAKYHERYEQLSNHKLVNESLYSEAMEILGNRNNTIFEEIVAIDSRTGERIVKNIMSAEQRIPHSCGFTAEETLLLNQRIGTFETLHNHPSSSIPSRDDIVKLFDRENQSASNICGHNGSVFRIEKLKNANGVEELAEMFYSDCKGKYSHLGEDVVETMCSRQLINTLERGNFIRYTERV